MLTQIVPAGLWIPPGLSAAIRIDGGKLLLLSGLVGVDSQGAIVGDDVETQLHQTFKNIELTLAASGTDFQSVARLTYYIVNYQTAHLQALRTVRDRFVNLQKPPASTILGVAALALPSFLVEVDVVAVVL